MSKIVAHTLVKNEQRWIWYVLMSVLDFVDEIMVWDTGSTDDTVSVVKSISSPKIKLRQIKVSSPEDHTAARNAMLKDTRADWLLVLDGDEIWWSKSLKGCLSVIEDNLGLSALISPFINVVGDIYHVQHSSSSHYSIKGHQGAYNLRFINLKIPGLHVGNPHGRQEYRDENEIPIQKFPDEQVCYADYPYLHTTHLLRSVTRSNDKETLKRGFKYRLELGRRIAKDFIYPEALYLPRPESVPDPFVHRSGSFVVRGLLMDSARAVKRLIAPNSAKSGY